MNRFLKHKLTIAFVGIFLVLAFPSFSLTAHAAPPAKCDAKTETAVKALGQDTAYTCCPKNVSNVAAKDRAKACLFEKYLNPIINFLAALVIVVVIIGIIYGAVLVSSSGGDPQKAASGKNHIRNALIGLLAYILFYAFVQFLMPGGKL
jgi:hypothetical protein